MLRGSVTEGETATAQRRIAEAIRTRFLERFGEGQEPRAIQRIVPADNDPSRYLGQDEAPAATQRSSTTGRKRRAKGSSPPRGNEGDGTNEKGGGSCDPPPFSI